VRAWRICQQKYAASAFSGDGAFRYGGRWNSRGISVVYLGGNPSIAALEVVVNTDDPEDLPRIPYVLIPVDFDETLVSRPDKLPDDWNQDPPPPSAAAVGDAWVRSGKSAILEVPSAVIPLERNYLLNPQHPDIHLISFREPEPFKFDSRLGKLWEKG
jgi:RES domain-containing protein